MITDAALAKALSIVPLSLKQASQFVANKHSHHKPPQGGKFAIGVQCDGILCGVVIVGHPVARMLDNGITAEITRCCTDGTANAASKLYRAAVRTAAAMGYKRVISYTLETERGTSLVAAGFNRQRMTTGGSWSRKRRERQDKHPLGCKVLWQA
jgi:hypothetical protein